ncbi:OmpA family protein [Erwinia sp. AnSW2-5]|uniref:OmpA family protein n=1 Tax=Erwinia sp. AnSW2-5 TaxID=3367692 RepID=UPI00385D375F
MSPALQRVLALWTVLLVAVVFLPVPQGVAVLLLLIGPGLMVAVRVVSRRRSSPEAILCADGLPDAAYRRPVVLVCGDSAQAWPHDSAVLSVSHGCWLRVEKHQELDVVARQLLALRPEWGRQLSVMVSVCPQQHQDTKTLTSRLLALRWQIGQLRRETGYSLPLVLNGQVGSGWVNARLWQAVMPGQPVQVWRDSSAPCALNGWLAAGGSAALQQQVLMNSLTDWFQQDVVAVFTDSNPDMPAILPTSVVWGLSGSLDGALASSVWMRWLQQHTGLVQVAGWSPAEDAPPVSLLPEFALPLLPKGQGLTPRQRAWRGGLWMAVMAGVVALGCSSWNNHRLLQRVVFDMAHYQRIAMNDYAAKAAAVSVLHQDAAELDRYARNGAPLRLGLGLYQGEKIRLPLLEAIRSYVPPLQPPPPVKEKIETIIRLDSLSLFDSGKAALKDGSTKTLVHSLVGIKAKPGWLIVVSGHTDNTGNPQLNQVLSLKRAAAVRDWMRDTGDVPESCFAVQGYGASRPVAPNDTAESRALNRRVEISLVPQADACQVPATQALSQDDDITVSPK